MKTTGGWDATEKDNQLLNRRDNGLLGIPIGVPSLEAAVAAVHEAIDSRDRQIVFSCANSHSLNVTRRDPAFREALIDAEQLVADGSGVTLLAHLARKDVGPRIIGYQYFEAVMASLQQRGSGRVFFFGSSQRVLDLIGERFARDFPALALCGTISPPYGEWDEATNTGFLETINAARPDVLWVGMTAPKQEKWSYRNRERLAVPLIGNIGAVFDFYAGTVKASPDFLRRIGLEAIYRLAMEPRRMWQRDVSSFEFLTIGVWREVLGFGRDRRD